ncbi:MAG: hypothetical protein M1825_004770 [Sarcosagium campestre]|nr:MAG: hypothetical protein M1825_004770 [Sarcosagium campestre]
MSLSSLFVPPSRLLVRARNPSIQTLQRRWAQVLDVRFLATHADPQRVLDRYKDKLQKKAKDHGLKDVEQLREIYKQKIIDLQRRESIAPQNPTPSLLSNPTISGGHPPPPPPRPAEPIAADGVKGGPHAKNDDKHNLKSNVKPLSAFIDIPKTLELPTPEVEYIWRLRHASSPQSLCAVIETPTYERMAQAAAKHPQFILPLPREGQGAEIHFLQWTFPTPETSTILFTHLAEYKLRGEFAQPHTTVTHHLELAAPKGLVLLQGSVMEGRGVTADEARWLLMCLQRFYGVTDGREQCRKRLMEQFSKGDSQFKVEELLEEAERIS